MNWRNLVNAGHKKYRLPNVLNLCGVLCSRIGLRKIGLSLIRLALFINPSHAAFRFNYFHYLERYYRHLNLITDFALPVMTVKAWCEKNEQPVSVLNHDQTSYMNKPQVINDHLYKGPAFYEGPVQLPEIYLAELNNALFFGGTDLIVVKERTHLLYDELAADMTKRYNHKTSLITSRTNKISIKFNEQKIIYIPQAIHFTKAYSRNYFHWLIECLPRFMIIDQFPSLQTVPLIIDSLLHSQQLDALNLINQDRRFVIQLPMNQPCQVDKLYYPSSLSVINDNYSAPVQYNQDILYSPAGIHFVREFFLNKLVDKAIQPSRKLYVSRGNSPYRRMVNSEKIETLMREKGFEIVYPEKLSFVEQVQLFAQASVVVGPSGAGLANLIFAPKECKAYVLISDDKQMNLNIFHGLADPLGIELNYILGKAVPYTHAVSFHNNYRIDIDLLRRTF